MNNSNCKICMPDQDISTTPSDHEFYFLDKNRYVLIEFTINCVINSRYDAICHAKIELLNALDMFNNINEFELKDKGEKNKLITQKLSLIHFLNKIRRIQVIDSKGTEYKLRMKEIV